MFGTLGRLVDQTVRAGVAGVSAVPAVLRSGLVRWEPPDRVVRVLLALGRYGASPATAAALAATRWPDRPGLLDERGALTFAQLDRRSGALAAGLYGGLGLRAGATLAVLCRNHRGFVLSMLAGSRLGADLVLLNTGLAAPVLGEVLRREKATAVLTDREFLPLLAETGFVGPRVPAASPTRGSPPHPHPAGRAGWCC